MSIRNFLPVLSICVSASSPHKTNQPPKTSICHPSRISNSQFQYSVPEKMMKNFYLGTVFGKIEPYNPSELSRKEKDANQIWERIIAQNPTQNRKIFATAGAPGAGKTSLKEQILKKHYQVGINYAYIDPDAVCLKQMDSSYQADVGAGIAQLTNENQQGEYSCTKEKEIRKEAYEYWRPASNAVNHFILGNLLKEGYGIFFGTTSSTPYAAGSFKF